MTTIIVPFHHDERLPDDSLPTTGVTLAPAFPDGDLWTRLTALHSAVADNVAADTAAGGRPAVVSGDCLVALGTLAGVQRAGVDPAVVWFDAHGDLHTEASSTSGYLGGMALRLAMGSSPVTEPLGLRPLAEARAVLVDARDLDPAEEEFLRGSAVTRVPVDAVGADVLPDGPLLLHVDLDVVDAAELTGMKFPAPGGPSAGAVLAAVRRVLDTGRVVAVDIACPWHPARDAVEAADRARVLAELLA
ncbi:arginase family protein [Actinokineospora soli]|uniref:Arginase family protein n=1 Tax=Actinokineospora soli TaxID=1048753 RepID=A0ABW2TMT5_9PSEU